MVYYDQPRSSLSPPVHLVKFLFEIITSYSESWFVMTNLGETIIPSIVTKNPRNSVAGLWQRLRRKDVYQE